MVPINRQFMRSILSPAASANAEANNHNPMLVLINS
jgi:hypothetical protein